MSSDTDHDYPTRSEVEEVLERSGPHLAGREARLARAYLDALDQVEMTEWIDLHNGTRCPECEEEIPGHTDDCARGDLAEASRS